MYDNLRIVEPSEMEDYVVHYDGEQIPNIVGMILLFDTDIIDKELKTRKDKNWSKVGTKHWAER